jgi:hypothetical protein
LIVALGATLVIAAVLLPVALGALLLRAIWHAV